MSFLNQHWENIQQAEKELGVPSGSVGTGFWRTWVSDVSNIRMLLEAIKILKPIKVVETGTYEGFTTLEVAKVLNEIYKDTDTVCKVYTFDTIGPVSCYSDGKTESTDWATNPQWAGWPNLVETRMRRINIPLNNCTMEFIDGLTQDTLPKSADKLKDWDFWYQDSVHGFDLILGEWDVMEPLSKVGSVVAFDDILDSHPWKEWFIKNKPNWECRWANKDSRSQLWAERIK